MHVGDTSLGGARADFPETVLDVVRKACDVSPDVQRLGLGELCRSYWKPAYHYFRVAWAKSNEDAKDLTQAFFLRLAEPDVLKKYDPRKASFRTFFKSLLRHFVQHHDEALGRLKRGGGRAIVPLEAAVPDEGSLPDPRAEDPEKAFETEWRKALIDAAVERVRTRLLADPKSTKFRVFEEYYLSESPERPTYEALGRRHGLSADVVQHHLSDVRSEIRREIRALLAGTAAGPGDLEEEWNAFLAS
jgi:RNA polymerase sigma-70 factor (ECF subfamily)